MAGNLRNWALQRLVAFGLVIGALLYGDRVRGGLVTYLPPLAGDTHSAVSDVNDAGVAIGISYSLTVTEPFLGQGPSHGVRWSPTGAATALGALGGTQSTPFSINNSGKIVGWAQIPSGDRPGATYVAPGPWQQLPNVGEATAINENGIIAGNTAAAGVSRNAYIYTAAGVVVNLGSFSTFGSNAKDINISDVVVGYSVVDSVNRRRAFRYTSATGIQTLAGANIFFDSAAEAINDSGVIVGTGDNTGFRWTNGQLAALPSGRPYDINEAGYVVGELTIAPGGAALWRPNNTLVNLNTWLDQTSPAEGALWTLTNAVSISNTGLIVGYGTYAGSPGVPSGQRGYMLNASALVPEPGMLGVVLLGLVAAARPRRPRRA